MSAKISILVKRDGTAEYTCIECGIGVLDLEGAAVKEPICFICRSEKQTAAMHRLVG